MTEPAERPDTHPRDDPAATVRRHPLDARTDPAARRYIRTDDRREHTPDPWDLLTGNHHDEEPPIGRKHDDLVGWPVQSLHEVATVLAHDDTPMPAAPARTDRLEHA